jgi:hypothetical protein
MVRADLGFPDPEDVFNRAGGVVGVANIDRISDRAGVNSRRSQQLTAEAQPWGLSCSAPGVLYRWCVSVL